MNGRGPIILLVVLALVAGAAGGFVVNRTLVAPAVQADAPNEMSEEAASEPAPIVISATGGEEESEVITPQGLHLEDGTFLMQDLGTVGHIVMVDGELYVEGEEPNDGVTDYIIMAGGSESVRVWQATVYQYRSDISFEDVLDIVNDRNAPDKFDTTKVHTARIWKLENGVAVLLDRIERGGDSSGSAAPSGWPATAAAAADKFGVAGQRSMDASQYEGCPGEDFCWHLMDGDPALVDVPSGVVYEGWDGTQAIAGSGPSQIMAAGITLRPS